MENVCVLYNNGLSIINISKKLKMSKHKVRQILIDNNIEIKKRGITNRKYKVYHDYFDVIDSEEKAYFLGFLYADGYNNVKDSFIRLTLHEKDKEILEKLNNLIQEKRPIATYIKKESGTKYLMLSIRSKQLSAKLAELGCGQKKTFIIKFPKNKFNDNLTHHFVRGYFDGDGCITRYLPKGKKTKTYQFSITSTEEFATEIINIFNDKLNIKINKLYERFPERNTPIRSIFVNGNNNCKKIKEWLYKDATIFLQRKRNIFNELLSI